MTLAVGFFDGVHLGHQAILRGADAALTFRNHPLTVLNAAKAPRLIMSPGERLAAIRACGVREVVALDFTKELAALSPDEFLATLPADLRARGDLAFRCGANWRFGRNGSGDAGWLRSHGHSVAVIVAATFADAPVSSTRIRECLARGEIAAANAMLGRTYRVTGPRIAGKHLGTALGYPTVNVLPETAALLPRGVYAVRVGAEPAIANYGLAPTCGAEAWTSPVLEIHFPEDVPANLPERLAVDILGFIRPERTFLSLDALRRQIAADIASAYDIIHP